MHRRYLSTILQWNYVYFKQMCIYHRQAGLHIRVDIQTSTKEMGAISTFNKNTTRNVGVCLKNYAVDVSLEVIVPENLNK